VELESMGPAWLGKLYALRHGIDLNEASKQPMPFPIAALGEWRTAMPEVPSAYRPSGALPVSALTSMTLGAGVGTGLTTLVVLAGGSLALVVIFLLMALMAIVHYILVNAMLGLLAFIAAVLPFIAGGWVAARTTTLFGRWAKNRNATVAQTLSVGSAGVSVGVAAGLFYVFGSSWTDKPGVGLVYWCGALFAAAIAMGVAGVVAGKHVLAQKFCEDCKVFMGKLNVKSLRLGALKAIRYAITEHNTEAAVSLLQAEAGHDGTVALFTCPHCFKGFVEVTAHFKARWRGNHGSETKQESWLVASLELPAAEMERFPDYPCDKAW
jgi:hypothetical protein